MNRLKLAVAISGMAVAAARAQNPEPFPAPQALELITGARAEAMAEASRRRAEVANEIAQAKVGALMQIASGKRRNPDALYRDGQRALDRRRWEEAVEAFTEAAAAGGSRADGALYWKAYALAKLGRRDEALSAIAELAKSHAASRWLSDARALEIEVKQASGQPVSPEAEGDEDLKLMALNGLMNSDPDRALPLIENLLKSSTSPRLKERALFVLAQSNASRGRQMVEQVARGSAGNPDLQLKAISYLATQGRRGEGTQALREIYDGASDEQVKRAVARAFMAAGDREQLLQIARTEKSVPLRMEAIGWLGGNSGQAELWALYQAEPSAEARERILHSMAAGGSAERLIEVARTEKDAKLRRSAIHALAANRGAAAGEALVSIYAAETDAGVKRSIVDALRSRNNARSLVELARKESDPGMKREIVQRLSQMRSKEAADYLLELLK